ncbi:MAG: TonB-dependent receptor [Verrucomicrobia bacterium]|nr:TonB-dependent receptor [Verrucomicrobiota bacterium]
MKQNPGILTRRSAGVLAAMAALSSASPPLRAQDAEPARVVVTGSYIPTAESEGPLPVTVYSASVLQKIGANTPVEGLRQLPSFVGNTATENDSNGGNGSANIALRGLGPNNTLTLINGRRTTVNGFGNVNAIPIGALDRSEILKDGAGAIYGSDAVAGVANLILINGPGATPLNGVEIDLLYGNTTDRDARVIQGYIRGGFANDKMAVAFAAEYYDRDAIFSRDREVSNTSNRLPLGGNNGGSPTFPGRVTLGGTASTGGGARILINPLNLPTGPASYRAYGGPASADPFNFRLYTPAIPPQEKYQTYVTASYNVFGKAMVAYADMLYAKTKQDNGLAPAPFTLNAGTRRFNNGDGPTGFVTNPRDGVELSPFNPFGIFNSPTAAVNPGPSPSRQLTAVQYRLVDELGNRRSFFDSDTWRYTFGLKGEFVFKNNPFIDFLNYDGGMVYERSDNLRIDRGDAQRSLIVAALAAGQFNPFRGLGSPVAGTAPVYNAAGVQTGTAAYDNAAAVAAASYTGRSFFYAHDFLIDARIAGNLFPTLPQGGIGFNVGMEFRSSRTTSVPDPVQVNGDQLGFNASPNTKYKQEVRSFYAEFSLPVITPKMKVPLVRSFDLSAAVRYEEFESFDQLLGGYFAADGVTVIPGGKKVNSGVKPRFTMRWQPIEDLTIRGSYGESFLAPTPAQLFAPPAQNFPQLFDPLTNQTLQVSTLQGGNPNLTPEKSTSWTAGLVYTPKYVRGLTITLDYYQIITRDVILPAANFAQLVLTANGQSGGTAFANLVTRIEDGTPTQILARTSNAGKRFVSGLDATAVYQLPYDRFGQFTFSAGLNYFLAWKAEGIAGLGATNFLGNYNNGTQPLAPGAIPRLKGFFRTEWSWKGFEWVGTINYIGDFKDDPAFILDPTIIPRTVPSYVTFDTQLSYEFKRPKTAPTEQVDGKGVRTQVAADTSGTFAQKLLWGTKLKVGVVNLFDRQPPSVLGAFNDNYDTSLYSIRNRYIYVGINKKF